MSDLTETVLRYAEMLRTDPEFAAAHRERRKAEKKTYAEWWDRLPESERQRLTELENEFQKGLEK